MTDTDPTPPAGSAEAPPATAGGTAALPPKTIKPTGRKPALAAAAAAPSVAVPPVAAPAAAASAVSVPIAAKESPMETIESATTKTESMFTEANARAQGALEKGQKLAEDARDFGKGNMEAMAESSRIAARGLEAITQEAAAFAKTAFEEAAAAARQLATVKSPTEFMKFQSDYARSAFDAMVAQASRNTEAMLKLAGEVVQPLSNRAAIAAEKMKGQP